ncbi:MAG: hypothetical protein GX542_13020 [Rhodococcus sp.]|nr:hypothetical protein [Rhodococcus sp. (in: high G+C Gram-positive bacteria)]
MEPHPNTPTPNTSAPDFAHTEQAARNRREKAIGIARYVWDRAIAADELLALPEDALRKLARAADAHPPRSRETWQAVADLLDEKSRWAAAHPQHPAAVPAHEDEKIMWIKPPVTPWN